MDRVIIEVSEREKVNEQRNGGRTRLLNFHNCKLFYCFVDVPGKRRRDASFDGEEN